MEMKKSRFTKDRIISVRKGNRQDPATDLCRKYGISMRSACEPLLQEHRMKDQSPIPMPDAEFSGAPLLLTHHGGPKLQFCD